MMTRIRQCPECFRRHHGRCRDPLGIHAAARRVPGISKPEPRPNPCQVCARSDRDVIEEKMRAGYPVGAVAEVFDLDHGDAILHRNEHLKFGRVVVPEIEEASDRWDDLAAGMAEALKT